MSPTPLDPSEPIRRVLVTGATGALGPAVVDAFLGQGHVVRVLARREPPAGLFSQPVESVAADLLDEKAVRKAMLGIDAVVHLVALLHIVNPSASLHDEYERMNVGGTRTVVSAAMEAAVRRVVFFSTIAVYGPGNGRILTEETAPAPDTFYGSTKLAAEGIVLSAQAVSSEPLGCVLRVAAVYGQRIKGNYQRLVKALARGRFLPLGKESNRRTLIHEKDLARAVLLAAFEKKAAGGLFNVSDGAFHTVEEIILAICEALGRKPPSLSIPVAPVRAAAFFTEKLLGRRAPVSRATIAKYLEDIAVDSSRIRRELGFQPLLPLREGWRETVKAMRQAGEI